MLLKMALFHSFLSLSNAMASHSSTLAWKIPWMEEPGGLQSMGSLRVRHDSMTSLSLFTFMHWKRKWHPLQCSCLENPRDGGAWWAAISGVAQGRTRLMNLSSSSSSVSLSTVSSRLILTQQESQFPSDSQRPLLLFALCQNNMVSEKRNGKHPHAVRISKTLPP